MFIVTLVKNRIFHLNLINYPNIDLRFEKRIRLVSCMERYWVAYFCVTKHANNWKQTLQMKENVNTGRGIICKPTATVIDQPMNIWSTLVAGLPFNLRGKHHSSIFVIYRKHHFIVKKEIAKLPCYHFLSLWHTFKLYAIEVNTS